MSFQRLVLVSIGLILSMSAVVAAQQTPSSSTEEPGNIVNTNRVRAQGLRKRGPRARKRMLGPRKLDRLARLNPQLNLSQEQRALGRSIAQRNLAATKTQREQLFQMRQKRMEGSFTDEDKARAQSLRQEIRSTMQNMRAEMRNILTAEQRTQLEAFRAQRKQRREEFLNRRKELRSPRP